MGGNEFKTDFETMQRSCLRTSELHFLKNIPDPGLSSAAPGRQTAEVTEAETPPACSPPPSDASLWSWCLWIRQERWI